MRTRFHVAEAGFEHCPPPVQEACPAIEVITPIKSPVTVGPVCGLGLVAVRSVRECTRRAGRAVILRFTRATIRGIGSSHNRTVAGITSLFFCRRKLHSYNSLPFAPIVVRRLRDLKR